MATESACGNANLISVVPALQLKLGISCVPEKSVSKLTELSKAVSEIANLSPNPQAPYVGIGAFTHKGGIHVSAVEKNSKSYEHIEPEAVGNRRHVVLSELSGRSNVRVRAAEMGLDLDGKEKEVVSQIKDLENRGYEFENAEGSIELFVTRMKEGYSVPFKNYRHDDCF